MARAHVRSTIYFFRDEQRGEAPFFTSRLLDFVGVVVLSFFSGFFLFSLSSVEFLSERQRHTFKGKKNETTAEEERRRGSFVSRNFFFFGLFCLLTCLWCCMYGRQQTTTVFGALLSFIITHIVLFRSFEDKGDDDGGV